MAMLQSVFLLVLCAAVFQEALGRAKFGCNNLGITGGHKIDIKAAPYMAGLFDNGDFICGASIIDEQFVLTTADCIEDPDNDIDAVHIGGRHVEHEGTYIDVDVVYCHLYYNPKNQDNNICLVKLSEPIKEFNRNIAKVQLPDKYFVIEEGTMVNLTGWGSKTTNEDGKYPKFLQQTTVPVVSNRCCREINPDMTRNMFCAGSPGRDHCRGDLGGPVTVNDVQIGIMSDGFECGTEPGFNTKVSKYIDWINTTIRNHS